MVNNGEFFYLGVRKTSRSIRYSLFQLLVDTIKSSELGKFFQINKTEMSISCVTGAKFISSGLDDVEKLKSISGINRIIVEEASEITEEEFSQLDLRLRGKNDIGHQMTLIFNPISELHWLKRRFFDSAPDDCYILKTTYKDNWFIDDAYRNKLQRLKEEDYQYYKIYALGEWGSIGNLIFSNWELADLSKEMKNFDNFYNGNDWGFADDPFAAVRVHHDPMRKIIYVCNEIYRRGIHNDEAAVEVKKMIGNEMITSDSAEPKSISDFRRLGVKAKGAKKGPGSVEHGIRWLQGHKIIVDKKCMNMVKELSSYKWREDKDGNVMPKPADVNNHLIDSLRYALEPSMSVKSLRSLPKNALGP